MAFVLQVFVSPKLSHSSKALKHTFTIQVQPLKPILDYERGFTRDDLKLKIISSSRTRKLLTSF